MYQVVILIGVAVVGFLVQKVWHFLSFYMLDCQQIEKPSFVPSLLAIFIFQFSASHLSNGQVFVLINQTFAICTTQKTSH